jgi:hypothetical protein
MTDEEIQQRREQHARRLDGAWFVLSQSVEFEVVMQSLQIEYAIFKPSFTASDSHNSHAAAQRDGQRQVLNEIMRRIACAKATNDADISRQSETSLEFRGT